MDLELPAPIVVQLDSLELAKGQERKPEQGFGEGRRQIDSCKLPTQVPSSEFRVAAQ